MTPKEQAISLAARLRDAAKLQDPVAASAISLVRLTIEELKDSLVSAEGDDMLRLQGAVRHFQRLHKELTVQPPSIRPTE